jgi:hypothetical protein
MRPAGDRAGSTYFQRHRPGTVASLSAVHDLPPSPTVLIDISLHCRTCKAGKQTQLCISADVKRPQSIVEYQCARCSPRRKKYVDVLSKRYPLAYGSYRAMRARCTYKSHGAWENYGGRGITICPRWTGKNGFSNFVEDMGERTADLSIDRIDVNGNYTPQNCRWATAEIQAGNKRNSAPDKDMEEAAMWGEVDFEAF